MGIWRGEEPETFRVLSDPRHSLATQLFWGFSPVSPHKSPYTVPSPVHSHPQIQWQARSPGLGQLEAPAKQILALCCCLCPQLHTLVHPLTLPALPSCSLCNVPTHTAAATPTPIAITMLSLLLLWPLTPGHHPATHPACRVATMRRWRFQGHGNVLRCHAERFRA